MEAICENKECQKKFDNYSKWGPKRFCSRTCANSRMRTDEVRKKISTGVKKHYEENGIPPSKPMSDLTKKKISNTKRAALLEKSFEELGINGKRSRILLEQNQKCNRCGIDEWQGESITLELDHKDGDKKNESRNNLECLCPNCHSLTPTWRGRNIKKYKDR